MKNTFLFGTILIILIVFSTCRKPVEEFYLTAEEKAMIPFKGYETITFISDSYGIEKLVADNRVDEIKKYYTDHTERNYIQYEDSYINFSNEKYSLGLFMSSYPFPPKSIAFSFGYTDRKNYFHSFFELMGKDSPNKFLDSLFVIGSWIPDVYYDTMEYVHLEPSPDSLLVFPVKSYYSKQFGVVRIDFSDGLSWELESIDWGK
jgi:hypothetical protein